MEQDKQQLNRVAKIRDELRRVIRKLKGYRSEFYTMSPLGLAKFLKIKSNLIRKGLYITDEMLELPEDQLINLLERQLRKVIDTEHDLETDYQILKLLTDAEQIDTEVLDKERPYIRKTVMSQEVTFKLVRSGKQFTLNGSANMRSYRVNVPSSWKIELPQSLLLELYDEAFGVQPLPNLNTLSGFVNFMFNRYQDYGAVKAVLEIELMYSSQLKVDVDDSLYNACIESGITGVGALVLAVLVESVLDGTVDEKDALSWLGEGVMSRKRIVRVFKYLLAQRTNSVDS